MVDKARLVFCGFLIFILLGIVTFQKINKPINHQQDKLIPLNTPEPPTPTPTALYKSFIPIFSGDHSLFVQLGALQSSNQTYKFNFSVYDWEGTRQINTDYELDNNWSQTLLETIPETVNPYYNKIYLDESFMKAAESDEIASDVWEHLVAISHSGSRIAILGPDMLILYTSKSDRKIENDYERISLIYSLETRIPLNNFDGTIKKFYFTGDESRLIVDVINGNTNKIYDYSADSGLVSHKLDGFGFTPIPSSHAIAFFSSYEDTYGTYLINYFDPDSMQTIRYPIPGKGVDSISNLTISPNQKIVCFEQASSGYHGYSIYRLSDMHLYDDGEQYSFCEHWIDNSKIIIRKKPHNNPSSVTQKLIYDINTGNETFISVENHMYKY